MAKCAGVFPTEHPDADSLVRTFFDQVNRPVAATEVECQLRMVRTQLEQRQRDQQPVDVDVDGEPPSAQRLMMTGLQFFKFFDFYASPTMRWLAQQLLAASWAPQGFPRRLHIGEHIPNIVKTI